MLLLGLAIVWAIVLIPPWLRERNSRPSARPLDRLDALARAGRATGVMARGRSAPPRQMAHQPAPPAHTPADPSARLGPDAAPTRTLLPRDAAHAKHRRRTVMAGLAVSSLVGLLLGGLIGALGYLLFLASLSALAGYGWLVVNHGSNHQRRDNIAPLHPPVRVGTNRWAPSGIVDEAVLRRKAN